MFDRFWDLFERASADAQFLAGLGVFFLVVLFGQWTLAMTSRVIDASLHIIDKVPIVEHCHDRNCEH